MPVGHQDQTEFPRYGQVDSRDHATNLSDGRQHANNDAGKHKLNEVLAEPDKKVAHPGMLSADAFQNNHAITSVKSAEHDEIIEPTKVWDKKFQPQPDQRQQK